MPEHQRRPALHPSQTVAEPPRAVIQVEELPDPPQVQAPNTARPTQAHLDVEESALHILREEMDELAFRLNGLGLAFTPPMRQEMVDVCITLLNGIRGGGTLARRA